MATLKIITNGPTKQCYKCKQFRPITDEYFFRRNGRACGFGSMCKECESNRKRVFTGEQKERMRKTSLEWAAANREKAHQTEHEWRAKNFDRIKQQKAEYYQKNKERKAIYAKEQRELKREEYQLRAQKYYADNKEKVSATNKKWREENPGIRRMHKANRDAAQLQATPKWLTSDDRELMGLVYAEAAYRGMMVDHIVPLQGKNVCGLHIYYNTQLLTKQENSIKHNKWPCEPRVPI